MKGIKIRTKLLSFLLLFVTILAILTPEMDAKADEKKDYVLYISSYSYAWETVSLQIAGIQDALSDRCVINYEFMDTKNVSYGDDYKEF